MSRLDPAFLCLVALATGSNLTAQSLFAPSATVGTSANSFVGVGTSSPNVNLTLAGATPSFGIQDTASSGIEYYLSSRWGGYFTIYNANYSTPFFTLDPGGNAGIGVLIADNKLDIAGATVVGSDYAGAVSAPLNGLLVEGNVGIGATSPKGILHLHGPNSVTNELILAKVNGSNAAEGILFTDDAWTSNGIAGLASVNANDDGSYGGFLTLNTVADGSGASGVPTERLRITSSGNVGIGIINPSASLAVFSAAPSTSANLMLVSGQDRTPRIQFNGPWSISNPSQSYAQIAAVNDNGGPGTSLASLHFYTSSGDPASLTDKMMISGTGNVGIGTTNPTYPLSVNGTIEAKEVLVQSSWSDFVFDQRYALEPLSKVEAFIRAEHHLPGVPSAAQVATQGVSVGKIEATLLAKIEELTLHQIEQEKRLDAAEAQIERLQAENTALRGSK